MAGIKKNFFYSSILTSANYLFPLLLFPYVSRVLGVTNVGIVNFVDSVINYFILFSMMGISVLGIREIAQFKNDQDKLSQVFSSLFLLNTFTTSITLILLIFCTLLIPQLFCHWQMMLIGAVKLVINFMLIEWFYKGLEEFKFITVRTIVVKIIFVISVFLFVRDQSDYSLYYLLSVLMIAVNAVINLMYSRKFVKMCIRNTTLFQYAKPFFVLGLYSLLTSMYITFNIMYLGFVSGETEVGYYVTASKLHRILIAIFSAFTGVMLPRISSLLAEGKIDEFRRLLAKSNIILVTFSLPLMIFTIVYAPIIIYIIAGNGYEGAVLPMRIMMPLIFVIGYEQILVIETLTPLKKDRAQLINSILGAFVAIVLNIILVPLYQSVGSSVVWLISEIIVLASAQYFVTKYVRVTFPWRTLVKQLMLNLPLLMVVYLLYEYYSNKIVSIGIAFFSLLLYTFCLMMIFNKEEMITILKMERRNH